MLKEKIFKKIKTVKIEGVGDKLIYTKDGRFAFQFICFVGKWNTEYLQLIHTKIQ
jgi:hypothetical protein